MKKEIQTGIKDKGREYLQEVTQMSIAQKINQFHIDLYGRKADPNLSTDRILNRMMYRNKFRKYIEDTENTLNGKKKKKFKWPAKYKSVFKKSKKMKNHILVWFLNMKGEIEPPKLHPLYLDNMVIIRNRPYECDPRSFWRMGKYTCQLVKGIDRRPVSNLDYAEIKARGDSTDSDEFLIKAAVQAIITDGKPKKPISRQTIIMIVIVAACALGAYMIFGGGA